MPYVCNCGKTFRDNYNLTRHLENKKCVKIEPVVLNDFGNEVVDYDFKIIYNIFKEIEKDDESIYISAGYIIGLFDKYLHKADTNKNIIMKKDYIDIYNFNAWDKVAIDRGLNKSFTNSAEKLYHCLDDFKKYLLENKLVISKKLDSKTIDLSYTGTLLFDEIKSFSEKGFNYITIMADGKKESGLKKIKSNFRLNYI